MDMSGAQKSGNGGGSKMEMMHGKPDPKAMEQAMKEGMNGKACPEGMNCDKMGK